MEATRSTNMKSAKVQQGTRGLLGHMSDRTAQVVATIITTGVFATIGYALNVLFTALSNGA